MIDELEHQLSLAQSGIQQMNGTDGMNNRIREWLATPEGTMAEKPRWGHNLRGYQFDPPGPMMAIEIEMSLVRKIRQDVRDLTIRGISVEVTEIDMINLFIIHDNGIFKDEIPLQEVIGG